MNQKTGCRKWLTGCGWLLAGGLLLIAITVAWNWKQIQLIVPMFADMMANPEYGTGLNTADDLLAYAEANPETVAIVAYSVAEDGSPIQDETAVWHNADEAMPLASTKKILVLAAYAHAVAEGRLDPQTSIAVGDWDHYHLPETNGGAHIAALNDLGIEVDGKGYAVDPTETVIYEEMVYAMIRFSDNAAPDYFIDLLGQEAIAATMRLGGLEPRPLLPHAGLVLTWQNREQTALTAESLAEMTALEEAEYARRVLEMQEAFIEGEWGQEERAWRLANTRPINPHRLEMSAADLLDNKGTAREFAHVMAGVVSGTFISAEVSAVMRSFLEWPMEFAGNQEQFSALGSKGGALAGLLTEASYYVPLTGDFGEQPRVVVIFMREIPLGGWVRLTQTFGQQIFSRELAISRAFATKTAVAFPAGE
ncbi:MAG: serine hydrolase [Chloroflexi bacterium]|nr:serine hydrolase [Chloroflexota bacterium]